MGSSKRSDYMAEEEDRMASFAQIPTSFGHELRACLRCRLVKTYDQVSFSLSSPTKLARVFILHTANAVFFFFFGKLGFC